VDERLQEAVDWCKEHGLEFDAVNDNLPETIKKYGCNSRKIHATCYIDDLAVDKEKYSIPFSTENAHQNRKWIRCKERMPQEHDKPKDIYDLDTLAIIDCEWHKVSNPVQVAVWDWENEKSFVSNDMTVDGAWANYGSEDFLVLAWQPLAQAYVPCDEDFEENDEASSEIVKKYPIGSLWEFRADGFTIPVRVTEHRQNPHGVDIKITSVSNGPLLQHYKCCRDIEWFEGKLFKKEVLNGKRADDIQRV
jgi:hypothetical protein